MGSRASGILELPDGRVECRPAVPCLLTDAAAAAGVVLNVACGGKGTCGGCAVELLAGRFATISGKKITLVRGKGKRVLACRTKLLGGRFRLRVPPRSLIQAGEKIVVDFAHAPPVTPRPAVQKVHLRLPPPVLADQRGDLERIIDALRKHGCDGPIRSSVYVARSARLAAGGEYELTVTVTANQDGWHIVRLEPGQTTGSLYGAAVDVGTTTVVVALVDLVAGRIADAASSYNQQVTRCDDVASRISYADDNDHIGELRDLVVEGTVNRLLGLLKRRHGLAAEDIAHMTVAGNSVMTHLFCGMSPTGLGGVPFAPVSNFPGPYRAGQLHLDMNPEGFVDVFPSSAAYVGGDITADMYMCGLAGRNGLSVLIDIGTNAEIVVGNRDRLIACAAPAGPAFEGRGLSCGMRAAAGAIDSITIDDLDAAPRYTVIGDCKPAGVCGSGLIDFIAQAFAAGVIDQAGRFTRRARTHCKRVKKTRIGRRHVPVYVLADSGQMDEGLAAIAITESDIAVLLQAKGVIFAALQIAMKHFGKGLSEIDRFYLAGGFARHINLDNAVTMGLLPDIDRGKYVFVGNGSLGGAFLALADRTVRTKLGLLAASPSVIELNLDPDFMDAYTLAMFLPNAEASLFPNARTE